MSNPSVFPTSPILADELRVLSVLSVDGDNDGDNDGEGVSIQIATGVESTFNPAGLKAPTWFLAVNPTSWNDPDDVIDVAALNESFAPYNQDSCLILVSDASVERLREEIWSHARKDCSEHAACDNGGLYALWDLGEGQVALLGCDNGGSDMAQFSIDEVVKNHHGKLIARITAAHFVPDNFFEAGTYAADHVSAESLSLLGRLTSSEVAGKPSLPRM
jgi:hypothetical protein